MSAYAYCHDCHEVTTGVMDMSSKGFRLGGETNHIGCKVTYLDPTDLPRPIAYAITLLATRPERVTSATITMLRLGLDLHDYPTGALEAECPPAPSPAPAAASTSPTSPAPAPPSDASTRSPRASTPTSATPAREADLLDLLEATA